MKKKEKFYSKIFNKEITFIIDKNMKPAKPVGAIARKIAEANEAFSKIKNIEDVLPRHSASE